jgi:hypothetical protein
MPNIKHFYYVVSKTIFVNLNFQSLTFKVKKTILKIKIKQKRPNGEKE